MKLYKLTITKSLDRKGLAKAFGDFNFNLSVAERLKIVDNLPFVDDQMWTEPDLIKNIFAPFCEYTYERTPFPGNSNYCTPPWESEEYIAAKEWYNTLSAEDRKRIDVLVSIVHVIIQNVQSVGIE